MSSIEASMVVSRVDVLGVGVSAINMDDALEVIDEWITSGDRQYVCVTGVHGVMESQRDESLRQIHNDAGLVTPDGMPLVWISRWRGFRNTTRVYGPDLMLAVCQRSLATGYRHFFYGGQEGVPERLVRRLEKRFPGLVVAGTYSPPFRSMTADESEELVRRINDARPDIVWVGLSTPKQERWMAEYVSQLTAPVLIGVGAAFDFHAGLKRQAPRWMQRSGLEWLFRMATEPRRLGRRYLVNNPSFVWLMLLQAWRVSATNQIAPRKGSQTRHPAGERDLV
jgi:N-acetylglucosaminyldiphosphoundecaprenol N-acetyl-beta-D-mannosaminyltransferase